MFKLFGFVLPDNDQKKKKSFWTTLLHYQHFFNEFQANTEKEYVNVPVIQTDKMNLISFAGVIALFAEDEKKSKDKYYI